VAEEYNALAMQDASTKAEGERNIYTSERDSMKLTNQRQDKDKEVIPTATAKNIFYL